MKLRFLDLFKKPHPRPIATVSDVDDLMHEVAIRMAATDFDEERMEQFVRLFQQAARVRGLTPFQRDSVEGVLLTLTATTQAELDQARDGADRLNAELEDRGQ